MTDLAWFSTDMQLHTADMYFMIDPFLLKVEFIEWNSINRVVLGLARISTIDQDICHPIANSCSQLHMYVRTLPQENHK